MHRLNILIVQARPSHQIILHQACNALGVFNVRIASDLPGARAYLAQTQALDLLIVDHDMPALSAQALLRRVVRHGRVRGLLFVGQAGRRGLDLPGEARRQGLWVAGQLAWPLSTRGLQGVLQRMCRLSASNARQDIQTVMLPPHAR
ncbi:histidine kinase [Pseudomonas putida]|uniref:histidine kinase n=1 Tax=Pseudomonas putida TaxID=303 RepID=UPI00383AA01A